MDKQSPKRLNKPKMRKPFTLCESAFLHESLLMNVPFIFSKNKGLSPNHAAMPDALNLL